MIRVGARYCEHVAREERRKTAYVIMFYMVMAIAGTTLESEVPSIAALILANSLAIGRWLRLSELLDDYDRRTRHLN